MYGDFSSLGFDGPSDVASFFERLSVSSVGDKGTDLGGDGASDECAEGGLSIG